MLLADNWQILITPQTHKPMAKKFSKIPSDYTQAKPAEFKKKSDAKSEKKSYSSSADKGTKRFTKSDTDAKPKRYSSFSNEDEPKRYGKPNEAYAASKDNETKRFSKSNIDTKPKRYAKAEHEDEPKRFGKSNTDKKPYRASNAEGDKFPKTDTRRPNRYPPKSADSAYEKKQDDGHSPYKKRTSSYTKNTERPVARENEYLPKGKKSATSKPYSKDAYGARTEAGKGDKQYSADGKRVFGPNSGKRNAIAKPNADKPEHAFYKSEYKKPSQKAAPVEEVKKEEQMPLNKFISHCGICSRRDAVELIQKGKIKVNSLVQTEPGYKVTSEDFVMYENKRIVPQKNLVYYLLNKPKDYITTTDDPKERKTVLDLFRAATETRIFPVGRLDRNTTGLLLMTNDGELTQKLSHPKYNIRKVYQVVLDKNLSKADFEAIANGIVLEDGKADVDEIAYTNPSDKKEIGIQIHIGRNRIVRRIFESLGYEVKALDRVLYAGLTKKNLPRGKWRELTEQEVIYLKHYKG